MDVWGRQLCSIYAGDFVSDVQDPDLVQYGLNLPNAKLVLTEASGRSQELWISQSGSGAWVAKRVDQPYVYSLIPEQLSLVLDDWSMLRDTRLLRAHRQDVDSIELLSSNGTIRLTQGPDLDDDWSVAFRAQGAAAFGMDWLAEKATVQEFLGLVEQSEVTDWLPVTEQNASQVFAKGHTFSRFTFHFRHVLKGEQSSGLVGPIHTSSLGTSLRMFSRVGDDPVGLIPLEFHDWLERPLQGWRSRLVWDLKEGRLSRLKLSQGETVREYKRKIQGTWTYVDAETTPVELLPALDHLVFLRAEEHLAEGSQTVLSNPVAVEFFDVDGFQHPALIGPDGEGRIQIQVRGQSSIAKNQDLYRLLVDILGR
jgi:hypothetical protein